MIFFLNFVLKIPTTQFLVPKTLLKPSCLCSPQTVWPFNILFPEFSSSFVQCMGNPTDLLPFKLCFLPKFAPQSFNFRNHSAQFCLQFGLRILLWFCLEFHQVLYLMTFQLVFILRQQLHLIHALRKHSSTFP
jgi:hypothetical protein